MNLEKMQKCEPKSLKVFDTQFIAHKKGAWRIVSSHIESSAWSMSCVELKSCAASSYIGRGYPGGGGGGMGGGRGVGGGRGGRVGGGCGCWFSVLTGRCPLGGQVHSMVQIAHQGA